MKQKHLICVAVAILGLLMASYATHSRVESMGKSDDFFMDDISVFTNPANVNLYANFLTGELGQVDAWSYGGSETDPRDQWFGGAAAYKIGDGSKVTVGVVFNRDDALVNKLQSYNSKKYVVTFTGDDSLLIGQFAERDPNNSNRWIVTPAGEVDTLRKSDQIITYDMLTSGTTADSVRVATWPYWALPPIDTVGRLEYTKSIPLPVGKTEFFLGYSNGKDLHVGGHFYIASQDSGKLKANGERDEANSAQSRVYRGDIGINYGIGNHSLELAGGIADVSFKLMPPNDLTEVQSTFNNTDSEKAKFAYLRFFYDMPQFGAKLIPVVKYADSKVNVFSETEITGGVGLNKEIEKGVFYMGISGIRREAEDETEQAYWDNYVLVANEVFTSDTTTNTFRFNFGVEKSIAWKWFIVRVGGQKLISQQTVKNVYKNATTGRKLRTRTEEKWVSNTDDDGTAGDVVGFGVGFNFDNKLRVDGTINEYFPYQNPFGWSGENLSRLATRVSATYSF